MKQDKMEHLKYITMSEEFSNVYETLMEEETPLLTLGKTELYLTDKEVLIINTNTERGKRIC